MPRLPKSKPDVLEPGYVKVPVTAPTDRQVAALTVASLLEQRQLSPTPHNVRRLAQALGLSVDEIRVAWKAMGHKPWQPRNTKTKEHPDAEA